MKYEVFMKITDKWSDSDKLRFLMEYPEYHEMIMRFLLHNWRDSICVEFEHMTWFISDNHLESITNYPEEVEE